MKMKLDKISVLMKDQKDELAVLAATSERDIDTSDIAEMSAEDFSRAVRFQSLYKARKQQITARIDADVLLWLKSKGGRGYQGRLNAILREAMTREAETGNNVAAK
jgi:uncharacterized protein (DUF4415 family)